MFRTSSFSLRLGRFDKKQALETADSGGRSPAQPPDADRSLRTRSVPPFGPPSRRADPMAAGRGSTRSHRSDSDAQAGPVTQTEAAPESAARARRLIKETPAERRANLIKDRAFSKKRGADIDMNYILGAVMLRAVAVEYYEKNEWSRFKPRRLLHKLSSEEQKQLAKLMAEDPQALAMRAMREAQENDRRVKNGEDPLPTVFDRSLLEDIGQAHLLLGTCPDVDQFRRGMAAAAGLEGAHTFATRLLLLAAGIGGAMVTEFFPGGEAALEAGKDAVKAVLHQLPAFVIAPALSGWLRQLTDVVENLRMLGGQTTAPATTEKSQHMGTVAKQMEACFVKLETALRELDAAKDLPELHKKALFKAVDEFLSAFEVGNDQYKARLGFVRGQDYSKMAGKFNNGLGSIALLLTVGVPGAGQIAGPALLALTAANQIAAGIIDFHTDKHYKSRATLKYGGLIKDEYRHLRFLDLKPEYLSREAVRASFKDKAETEEDAFKEVIDFQLAKHKRAQLALQRKLDMARRVRREAQPAASEGTGAGESMASAPATQRARVGLKAALRLQSIDSRIQDLERRSQRANAAFDRFELDAGRLLSYDAEEWAQILPGSALDRALDSSGKLRSLQQQARVNRPGEGAQYAQRYIQGAFALTGPMLLLPGVDGIVMADDMHLELPDGSLDAELTREATAGAITLGAVAAVVFTAATGEVRASKVDNKKTMAGIEGADADTVALAAVRSLWEDTHAALVAQGRTDAQARRGAADAVERLLKVRALPGSPASFRSRLAASWGSDSGVRRKKLEAISGTDSWQSWTVRSAWNACYQERRLAGDPESVAQAAGLAAAELTAAAVQLDDFPAPTRTAALDDSTHSIDQRLLRLRSLTRNSTAWEAQAVNEAWRCAYQAAQDGGRSDFEAKRLATVEAEQLAAGLELAGFKLSNELPARLADGSADARLQRLYRATHGNTSWQASTVRAAWQGARDAAKQRGLAFSAAQEAALQAAVEAARKVELPGFDKGFSARLARAAGMGLQDRLQRNQDYEKAGAEWTATVTGKTKDLRASGPFRSEFQRSRHNNFLIGKSVVHGVFSGVVGLNNQLRHAMPARKKLHGKMGELVAYLDRHSGLPAAPPQAADGLQDNMAGLRARLLNHPLVAEHLRDKYGIQEEAEPASAAAGAG